MSDKLTNDQLKADLDAAGVEYPSDAVKADLVALVEDNKVQHIDFDPELDTDALRDGAVAQFGIVPEPMGDGSLGGAFVESGARLNTGGPDGPAKKKADEDLLDADRSTVFPGPSFGDAVAESGAAVNTGGPNGDGTLDRPAGGHRVVVDDGVPRSDLSNMSGNISKPNGLDDGVPRADLSSLAADARVHDKNVKAKAAKGIGTKDFSPVSEAELGVAPGLGESTVEGGGALVKPENDKTVQKPARPDVAK